MRSALLENGQTLRDTVLARLHDARDTAVWGRVFGNWGSIGGDGNAAHLDTNFSGLTIGADTPIDGGFHAGAEAGYGQVAGFIGASRVQKEITSGAKRKRVGIKPEVRAPAREGTVVTDAGGRQIGIITSGGFGPTANGPVAMGYVETAFARAGTAVQLIVRDKPMPAQIITLPFVPHNYKR